MGAVARYGKKTNHSARHLLSLGNALSYSHVSTSPFSAKTVLDRINLFAQPILHVRLRCQHIDSIEDGICSGVVASHVVNEKILHDLTMRKAASSLSFIRRIRGTDQCGQVVVLLRAKFIDSGSLFFYHLIHVIFELANCLLDLTDFLGGDKRWDWR